MSIEYWRENRELKHLTPPGTTWPEGDWFPIYLSQMFEGQNVTEFGCGAGRLSVCFQPSLYTGYDPNMHAIRAARVSHPIHDFFVWQGDTLLGDVFLCHTVLLHVSDDDIRDTIGKLNGRRIVVSEIMDRDLRVDQKNPPVYNRSLMEYQGIMGQGGFVLQNYVCLPYEHYHNTQLTIAAFERE